MKTFLSLLLLSAALLITACDSRPPGGEEIVTTYPGGKKRETAVYDGQGAEKKRVKVFEYYETGEKKKEYNFQDNLFHGPFTYWYRDGKVFAQGHIENKAINLGMVTGRETYFWPNGVKMLEAETVGGKAKPGTTPVYRDENGKEFTDAGRPEALVKKTRELTDRWERGEI